MLMFVLGYLGLVFILAMFMLLFHDLKDFEMESVSDIMKGEKDSTKLSKFLMYILVIFWVYPSMILLAIAKKLLIK